MPNTEQLLTLAEIQKRLNLSRSSLVRLIATGKLTARKVGLRRGTWRVAESDLTAYAEHEQLLTLAQVQQRLNLSRSTVLRLIRAGKLPARKIGLGRGSWRLSGGDLAGYIEAANPRGGLPQAPNCPACGSSLRQAAE